MLEACILHPDIYEEEYDKNPYYYGTLIMLLKSILQNGLVVEDSGGILKNESSKRIDKWKDMKREGIKLIRKQLYTRNKIVRVDESDKIAGMDKENLKEVIITLASITKEIIIIPPNWSNNKVKEWKKHGVRLQKITELERTKYYNQLMCTSKIIEKEDSEGVEEKIIANFCRYAKEIKIVDRIFGEGISDYGCIKRAYKMGLEMVIQLIKKYNKGNGEVKVILFTGLKTKDEEKKNTYKKVIENYIKRLETEHGIVIELCIMPYDKVTHDRYLFTNHAALQIGRGLDYKDKDKKIRDNTLCLLSNEDKNYLGQMFNPSTWR